MIIFYVCFVQLVQNEITPNQNKKKGESRLKKVNTTSQAFKNFIISYYIWANLLLGGIIKNVTPQNFETHPTSKQHRTYIKIAFHSKLFIKRLPKSCR
jgi:hypothetical protein